MRHVLLVLSALLSFAAHAAKGIGCQDDFVKGSKLLVGRPSERLEAKAHRVVLAEFNRTVGNNQGQAADVETLMSLRVSQGLIVYVIGIPQAEGETKIYAVRVSDRDHEITHLEANQSVTDDEDTPAGRIEPVAARLASINFPYGTMFPGQWEGDAPKVTHTLVTLTIPTGINDGVVLIDVHGENAKGSAVLHAVALVRNGLVYWVSELQPMTLEQNEDPSVPVSAATSAGTAGPRGISEARALMVVLEKILEADPTSRVSAVTVQSLNIEKTIFTVTANRIVTRPRGHVVNRASVYQVSVDAQGVPVITHIAEQG